MFEAIRAESVQKSGYAAVIAVVLIIALLYHFIGCARDWVVIGGLVIDGIGALLIAAPDLKSFQKRSYGGRLQDTYDAEVIDPKAHYIPKQADWYPVFLREMDDVFHRSVSDTSEFYIVEVVDTYNLFHQPKPNVYAQPMAVSVLGQQLRETIDREESQIRRTGAALLILGFGVQILGYIFDGTLGLGLIC